MNGTVILKRIVLLIALFTLTACGAGEDADPPPAPGMDATGTWKGDLPIGSTSRSFTFQLHRRGDGNVMGYVVGGTANRTVIAGAMSGTALTLEVELKDPKLIRTFAIEGTITGNNFDGTADDGSGSQAISWQRVRQVLHERRFFFANAPIGDADPTGVTEFAVVLDKSGNFVSGGFVGEEDCDLLACGGGLTSFNEALDTSDNEVIEIGLESSGSGGCPTTGLLQATFDSASKFYAGSYTISDCLGVSSGDVIGVKFTRTQTDHVASVLASFGRMADDLEAGIAFSVPYVPFSPEYLHNSETVHDRIDGLNTQVATYESIDMNLSRFRNIHTVDEPDILPDIATAFQADFHDQRKGIASGDTLPTIYRDADTQSSNDELKYLKEEGGNWVIYGNHIRHDLPFASYSLADDHVVIHTGGGDIYMSIGPWGAHVGPHTGHLEGNAKADWGGQYAWTLDQLTELDGNSNGVCETGEVCGLSAADLEARMVDYVAPMDGFQITEVRLERLHLPGVYFGSDEHWRINGNIANYQYSFGHLRDISADLRDAMIVAGYTDPWSVHIPGDNLITGDPIILNQGDTLARPQVAAYSLAPAFPGYYTGQWTTPETPWQQIEFFTFNNDSRRAESFYTWLSPALESQLATILEAQAASPTTFRYNQGFLDGITWMWKAEMALSNQVSMDREDYSTLFSALGGWWEAMEGPCVDPPNPKCDELFSIFPISKDTVFYDPGLYHHPDVSYLAGWRGPGPTRYGEVIAPIEPDPIAGTLVFKWKHFSGFSLGYQGASYRLDTTGKTLRIAWGAIVGSEGDVVTPSIPSNTDVCDGSTLTCHNHEWNGDNL